MKVFTCNNFGGHWPVPTAAVMVAPDKDTALKHLLEELESRKLPQEAMFLTLVEISTTDRAVYVLSDGDY